MVERATHPDRAPCRTRPTTGQVYGIDDRAGWAAKEGVLSYNDSYTDSYPAALSMRHQAAAAARIVNVLPDGRYEWMNRCPSASYSNGSASGASSASKNWPPRWR